MAEYIEREAAYDTLTGYYHHSTDIQHEALIEALSRVPAADVAPVVRCGECKHWFDNGTDLCSCDMDALLRRRDFFCADGERKDGDGDV